MPLEDALGISDPRALMEDLISQSAPDVAQNSGGNPNILMDRLIRKTMDRRNSQAPAQQQKPPSNGVDFGAFGKTPEEIKTAPPVDFSEFGEEVEKPAPPEPKEQEGSWLNGPSVFGRETAQSAVKGTADIAKGLAQTPEALQGVANTVEPFVNPITNPALNTVARAARAAGSLLGANQSPVKERSLYKAGEGMQKWAEQNIPVSEAERKQNWLASKTGQAVGGAAPIVLGGVAAAPFTGPVGGMALGGAMMGAQSGGSEFDRATKAIDEQIAGFRKAGNETKAAELLATRDARAGQAAGLSAAIMGTTGMLPVGMILKPAQEIAPGVTGRLWAMLDHAWKSGVTFAGVGEAQHWIGEQLAKEYDPKAHYEFDYQRLIAGFLAGGVFGAGHAAAQRRPKEVRSDTEGDTHADAGAGTGPQPTGGLPPPDPFAQKPWEGEPWGGMFGREGPEGSATKEAPQPFKSTMRAKLRTTLEEKAQYYKEFSDADIASWSDEKLKEYVNTKGGMGSAPDEDILRRAGHSDDDIKGMSPDEKRAAAQEAKSYGVHAGEEPERAGTRAAPVDAKTTEDVTRAAETANADHTPAQGEANNTQRGHMTWNGMGITIEAKKGGMRRGTSPEGEPFETQVGAHYGYFKDMPKGADGQAPDVFVGDHPDAPQAFVIDELDPKTGKFRQTKSFVGFKTFEDALDAYLGTSSKNPDHVGGMAAFSVDEFQQLAKAGGLGKAVAPEETSPSKGEVRPEAGQQPVYRESAESGAEASTQPAGENVDLKVNQPAGPTLHHIDAVEEALHAGGTDPSTVDHQDIRAAAEIHARDGVPPEEAFPVAVVRRLVEDGHLNPKDVRDALGEELGQAVLDARRPSGDELSASKASPATGRAPAKAADELAQERSEPRRESREARANGEARGVERGAERAGHPAPRSSGERQAAGGERPAKADVAGAAKAADAKAPALIGEAFGTMHEGMGQHSVTAADGTKVRVQPRVIEAKDLITSSDPGYDKALQPRQRDRAASQAQIREIATRLDPERLGYSAEADRGAPVVGADRMVESGNGRVAAIRALYRNNAPNAKKYREWLKGQGVDVAGFKEPVLVRQRVSELAGDKRAAFTVAANQAATLAMSAPERAMADAKHLTPNMLGMIEDASNLAAAGNRGFVRAFIAAIPASERGALTDSHGGLSAEGLARARNALLGKAYGDPDVIARITESTDDEIKSISTALTTAAPIWAKLRTDIETGLVRRDIDLTDDLMEAVKRTADLPARGQKLEEFLAQNDAFDHLKGPVEGFMRWFYDPHGKRAAGAARIAEKLAFYAEQARKVTNDPDLGLDIPKVSADDIQRAASSKSEAIQSGGGESVRSGVENGRPQARGRETGESRAGPAGVEPPELKRGFSDNTDDLFSAEPGAEGKPQLVIPGTERASSAELAKRRAAQPLKPKVAQKPLTEGLFAEKAKQLDLVDLAAQPPKPEGLVERIAGDDGTEVLIVRNSDGKRFNVVMRDTDAQETVGPVSIVDTIEKAKARAQEMLHGPKAAEKPAAQPSPAPAPAPAPRPAVVAKPEAKIEDFGEKIGGARKDTATSTGARKSVEKPQDDRPTWAKRFTIHQVDIVKSSADGVSGKRWEINDERTGKPLMDPNARWKPRTFATKEEAEHALPLAAVAQKHRVVSGPDNTFRIIRDVTERKRVTIKDGFTGRDEAMRYLHDHAVDILETKTGFGEEVLAAPETVRRQGPERRKGDANERDFGETFGFRGVEFGNWNNQIERQEVMNHAYDGLLDLADLLSVPPKALSLDGQLAIAFGARGHGLAGARAHYERDYGVINLTKMSGAGSLAHEWMHALDAYLARQDTKSSSAKVRNERGDEVYDAGSVSSDYISHGWSYKSQLRDEVKAALKQVSDTIATKAESYVEDTGQADKWLRRAKDRLGEQLNGIRAQIEKKAEYGTRNVAPADAEQLARFDALADKLRNGDDISTSWKIVPSKNRMGGKGRYSNDTIDAISALYKEVRGRSGFHEGQGPLDQIVHAVNDFKKRLDMMEQAAKGSEKTRRVPTQYARDAYNLDQGRSSDYWSTPHELLARAMSSYVEDKIAERGGRSDFLSYGSDNAFYRIMNARPFPEGAERKAINDALDKFFSTLEARPGSKPGSFALAEGAADFQAPPPERPIAPPFYSAVLRTIEGAKQEKAAPNHWLGTIRNAPGVKPEEIEWLGLEGWLREHNGPVTKQAIADYVRANSIELKEVTKAAPNIENAKRGYDLHPRYSKYQLPGGENYRELLLTLPHPTLAKQDALEAKLDQMLASAPSDLSHPEKVEWVRQHVPEYDQLAMEAIGHGKISDRTRNRETYRTSHWDEPNVLAHVRFNDRTIDGKKTLFLEEIQSDWHQAGKRKGYQGPQVTAEQRVKLLAERDELSGEAADIQAKRSKEAEARGLTRQAYSDYTYGDPRWNEAMERITQINEQLGEHTGKVPDAPFKTTWSELALKRMIRYAAEHDYEQVAWTTGKTQAARYDLGHQVESIQSQREPDGKYRITIFPKGYEANRDRGTPVGWGGDNDQPHTYEKTASELADFVGKDLADKIVAHHEPHAERYYGMKTWSGLDLRVGEGMTGFYDKMLPAAVNKLAKKFGGKVERAELGPPTDKRIEIEAERKRAWDDLVPLLRDEDQLGFDTIAEAGSAIRTHPDFSERWDMPPELQQAAQRYYDAFHADVSTKGVPRDEVHTLAIPSTMREAAVHEGFALFEGNRPRADAEFGFTDLGPFKKEPGKPLARQAQDLTLERGRETGVEHLVAINANGSVIAHGYGTENSVGMSAKLQAAVLNPDQSIVVHHNHPSDSGLSPVDIAHLALPGLAAVWAHSHGGNVARAGLTPVARAAFRKDLPTEVVQKLYDVTVRNVGEPIQRLLQNAINDRRITIPEAKAIYAHAVGLALERADVIDYRANTDLAEIIEDLGLEPYIDIGARRAAGALLNAPGQAAPRRSQVRDDRRAEPLRHIGDVGATFDRAAETAGERRVAEADDRYRGADDRGKEARGELGLPGFGDTGPHFTPPGAGASAGGSGRNVPPGPVAQNLPAQTIAGTLVAHNAPKLARISTALGLGRLNTTELRVKVQDKFLRWQKAEQAAERTTGKPVPEDERTYLAESLYYGRAGHQIEELDNHHIDPLIADIKKRGLTLEDVDRFLYARHAGERNAALRKINPAIADPSGMSDAEARRILTAIYNSDKRGDYGAIEKRVRALIDETRTTLVRAGLISRTTADTWGNTYKHYVPLRGWQDDPGDVFAGAAGTGRGFDIRGEESKRAMGRKSLADSPLAYAIMQAQQAVIRGEKNRVWQTANQFVRANPDDTLWTVDKGNRKRAIDPSSGLVKEVAETLWTEKSNVVAGKIAGEAHYIVFQGEYGAALARALNQTGTTQVPQMLRAIGAFTRFQARLATSWNPDFMIPNFVRDLGEAFINLPPDGQKRFAKQFGKYLAPALVGSFQALAGMQGGRYAQAFRDFDKLGGRIRFFGLDAPEDIKRNIESKMRDLTRGPLNPIKLASKALEGVEIANGAIENATRLAVFMAARDTGFSDTQAASLGREMTVNFNRKGELGAAVSALYMFANPAIQGPTRMLTTLATQPRTRKWAAALMAAGAALAIYNILGGGNDDDGIPYYFKLRPWTRDSNFIIMWPKGMGHDGQYVTIPLAYGFSFFHVIGSRAASLWYGEKKEKAVPAMIKSIGDAFDPLGRDENMLAHVSPSAFRPIVHLKTNENWTGRPINPPREPWNKYKPNAELYFRSASEFSKGTAASLNQLTGGTKAEKGLKIPFTDSTPFDISPGTMDYMLKFIFGGTGLFLNNFYTTGKRAYEGQEWKVDQTPILRRFYGSKDDAGDRMIYFEEREKVKEAKGIIDDYKKNKMLGTPEAKVFREQHASEINAANAFTNADKRRSQINKDIDTIKADKTKSAAEIDKLVRVKQDEELKLMATMRKQLDDARRRQQEYLGKKAPAQ